MEIIDLFIESNKNKFLNGIVKIPKGYDWYLGIVIEIDNFDIGKKPEIDKMLEQKCEIIYEKSNKNIKLLKICLLDSYTVLLFGLNAEPFNNDIKGILKSICKYIECKIFEVSYLKKLYNMVYSVWGDQQYKYLIYDNKALDLRLLREE